jgi:hypothetical protein
MDARRVMKRFAAAAMSCAALAGLLGAGEAQAGCGTLWTINTTDKWAWVTIYDLGHLIHMDYGALPAHSARSWTGGAGGLPYACGSYYHVRAEVYGQPNQKIFDTEVQVNPQLKNWAKLVASFVKMGITCVEGEAVGCAVKWGVTQGAEFAALGAESSGSVSCLKSGDSTHFYWDNGDACNAKPHPPVLKVMPASRTLVPGMNTRPNSPYRFGVTIDGLPAPIEVIRAGKWSTTNDKVVVMHDDVGHVKAVAPGNAKVVWTYKGKTYTADVHVEKH